MNALNPTSVAEAGCVMAPYLGYDWVQNRAEVVKGINRYREHLYNKYHRRKLFDDVFHCFTPQDFPLECAGRSRCAPCYKGATLPPDMAGVVKAWDYSAPLRIRSRWREAFTGRVLCSSELSLVVLPQSFPTERVFRAAIPLRFYTENAADAGKTIFMEAKMRNNAIQRLRFDLKADEWVESADPVYDILSITLPEGLRGQVTLATSEGYELSTYAPWERVPSYTRVKFLQPCPHNVFIQGTRRFVPVWFDPDIVEVGSANIMEFYAQYVRHNKAKDARDRDTAAAALQQANDELDGLIARHIAGAIQDGPRRGPRRNSILPGYERSHRQ